MIIYVLLLIITLLDIFVLDYELHTYLIFSLSIIVLARFVINLSRKINFIDIVAFIACITYLVMPWISYKYFDESNSLARTWQAFMPISAEEYFSFAIPGTILLIMGLNYTGNNNQEIEDRRLIEGCKEYLSDKKYIGLLLISLGVIASVMSKFLPPMFNALFYFFNQLTFIGILYLLHSRIPGRTLILFIAMTLLVAQSIVTSMYGELLYWSILGGIIMMVGQKKYSMFSKTVFLILGLFGILLLQSIKHEYRDMISKSDIQSNNSTLFFRLIKDRLENPENLFTKESHFAFVVRANQGFLVARAMEYVPRKEDYAKGETILYAIGASIVPRFIWPNKPMVGGKDNICRFLGDCWEKDYSYNIGQLGESYVNFGRVGGALFMFLYGWFIRYSYNRISKLSKKIPTLILWVPLFYFMVLSLESDYLTFFNSFTKAIIFAFFCYFGFRTFFKIRI